MGYATVQDVDFLLAQALTSARPDATLQKIKLININNVRDLNRIPDEIVEYNISLADNEIDAVLSQQYYTPFSKCNDGQWYLEMDIYGTDNQGGGSGGSGGLGEEPVNPPNMVIVSDSTNLVEGDQIIIHDDLTGDEEYAIVEAIVDQFTFLVSSNIHGDFLAANGVRVIRNQFPPPLNLISARFAAAMIYDKYFAAQSSPNVSDYGNQLRNMAYSNLDDILNGKTIIKCGRRKGDHFGNPWIESSYTHRRPLDDYGTSDRDKSKPK
jgi:hypothetical protein